jgi:hypothetical protein
VGGIEQALDAIGSTLAEGFSELPAILATDARKQAIEVATGTRSHFGATEAWRDLSMEGVKGCGTGGDNHNDSLLSVPRSLSSKCGCSTRSCLRRGENSTLAGRINRLECCHVSISFLSQ